jgi:hypothetical protein
MVQIFIEGKETIDQVEKLKKYAEENVVDYSHIETQEEIKNVKPIGDDPNHVLEIGTTRIVYSIEKQKAGKVQHLSVSKLNRDFTSRDIVDRVLKLFDMGKIEDKDKKIWQEGAAINFVKKMEER